MKSDYDKIDDLRMSKADTLSAATEMPINLDFLDQLNDCLDEEYDHELKDINTLVEKQASNKYHCIDANKLDRNTLRSLKNFMKKPKAARPSVFNIFDIKR
ncbi:hypothetical protein HZS_1656 [Henneguya salminicola]|nr:hypothetical protein HZS_1656 [Henneguya salminicola]